MQVDRAERLAGLPASSRSRRSQGARTRFHLRAGDVSCLGSIFRAPDGRLLATEVEGEKKKGDTSNSLGFGLEPPRSAGGGFSILRIGQTMDPRLLDDSQGKKWNFLARWSR